MPGLATVVQHALGGSCLASVDVSDDAYVADILDVGLEMGAWSCAMGPSPSASAGRIEAMSISANDDVDVAAGECAASQKAPQQWHFSWFLICRHGIIQQQFKFLHQCGGAFLECHPPPVPLFARPLSH